MQPVDRLEYRAWTELKNPTMRMAIINAYVDMYDECDTEIERVLDEWESAEVSGAKIRECRRGQETAMSSVLTATRYLNDDDPGTIQRYMNEGLYSRIQMLGEKVAGNDYLGAETRIDGLATMLHQGNKLKVRGDGFMMNETFGIMEKMMARGIVKDGEGKAYLGDRVDWNDERNRGAKSSAELRMHMVETQLPTLASLHPEYAERVFTLLASAAAEDGHFGVRSKAMHVLQTMSDDLFAGHDQTIGDVFERAATADPNKDVRARAQTCLERLHERQQVRTAPRAPDAAGG